MIKNIDKIYLSSTNHSSKKYNISYETKVHLLYIDPCPSRQS